MTFRYTIVCLLLSTLISCMDHRKMDPLALNLENPHYFSYKGKPTLLITSGEHYGSVLNLDFDYVAYLQTLADDSLNLTRVFAGPYVEPPGSFNIEKNTLAPKANRFICPWARSETSGYANGGNKFDLKKWDEQYFSRLKDFMDEANKRNIIVEFALFCPFYGEEQWRLSPMNAINNVNGDGPTDRTHVYTLDKSNGLLKIQDDLVKKIVTELEDYPNLIYEICNEPYFGGVTIEWQHHIATVIQEVEKGFSYKHLISQNIANGSQIISDPHPGVSVFNFHYATPPVTVGMNYSLNRVIGDNETGFKGNADSTYRKEGWAFILAGGGLYNNLDYSFTAEDEKGTFSYPTTQPGGGSVNLRKQLSYLQKFMSSFDFIRMRPDTTTVQNRSQFKTIQVLSEPGQQYGIYIFGKGPFDLDLVIPQGTYVVEYVNPVTGEAETRTGVTSEGTLRLTTPDLPEDVGIKITHRRL